MKKEIIAYLEAHPASMMKEIAQALKKEGAKDFKLLVKTIAQLEANNQVGFQEDGRVYLKNSPSPIRLKGVFRAHKKGFGFVTLEGGEEVFIGRSHLHYAIDGDQVEVVIIKVADHKKSRVAEAKIVSILEHRFQTAVGRLIVDKEKPNYAGYIQSKNQAISQRIYVRKPAIHLQGTEVVKVAIERYPCRHHPFFVACLLSVIGQSDEAGIDVLEVLESLDIVSDFSKETLDEANAIADELTAEDYKGRLDLRNECIITIDGEDAKDLDDAVHIRTLENGNIELGVHIADVSYYVKEGSSLDKEAFDRGTSVYVVDRVVPMLPERLSNGICSLHPRVDRLCQSALMEIDQNGQVVRYRLLPSVICTRYRMTYRDVNAILSGDKTKQAKYQEIVPSLYQMRRLHQALEQMRINRGALQFETHEAVIRVNQTGVPLAIYMRKRGIAEKMIESFMLVANETVARHVAVKHLPFLYRIHEEPKAEKMKQLIELASTFGIQVAGVAQSMSQKALQQVVKQIQKEPGAAVLSMVLLRSMQQARYCEQLQEHYGLAAPYYTHFTSPIRRYPDLLVHRMLREYRQSHERSEHFATLLPEVACQSSQRERRAVEAERTVSSMKKAEYMSGFIGEVFEGVISSVVKFGLFVELPNTVEGLVAVSSLEEFAHYHERSLTLRTERSNRVFRVGQPIKVRLVRSDSSTGEIDFEHIPSSLDLIEKKSTKTSLVRQTDRPNKKRKGNRERDAKRKRKNPRPKQKGSS